MGDVFHSFAHKERLKNWAGPGTSASFNVPRSMWLEAGMPGAGSIPETGAGQIYNSSSPGAMLIPSLSIGSYLFLVYSHVHGINYPNNYYNARCILIDRLVATSGLVSNSASLQTVNTVSLPRYTDGEGVWAALEWYAEPVYGTNALTDVTLNYTNSQGVSGRTSVTSTYVNEINSSGTNERSTYWFRFLNWQAGDTGIQSVQSIQLNAARTVDPSNFGVTLFRPLRGLSQSPLLSPGGVTDRTGNLIGYYGGDPCLQMIVWPASNVVQGTDSSIMQISALDMITLP